MDASKPGRAIANLEVILPNRVIEVSYLMKRQFEVVFDAANNDGKFSSKVKLFKDESDNIKINISLENLVLAGDRLCYHVFNVRPEDEENLASCLEKPPEPKRKAGRPRIHRTTPPLQSSTDPKRPRGRPRKIAKGDDDDNTNAAEEKSNAGDDEAGKADKPDGEEEEEEEEAGPKEYGRGKRKPKVPTRYLEDMELDTSVWSIVEDDDEDYSDEEEEEEDADPNDKNFVAPNVPSEPGRGRGRPRKHPISDQPAKPRKKRPNYKREQNIPCRMCGKFYKDHLTLWGHVGNIHAENTEAPAYLAELKELMKVKCKICGRVLSNKRNEMLSHMVRVHGEDDGKVYECDECGKQFRREQLVKEHKRRAHPPHDRVLCHLCPASFKLKEYLTEHLKYTHNRQQKWQCDICQKTLTSPKNLRRHKRLHGETLYSCNICGRGFHELANMRRHALYVHNPGAVERCKCPHCDRDFSTRNNLLAHINGVHFKSSPYYCDICKKYFTRKKYLLDHAQTYHPGVPILSTQEEGDAEELDDDATAEDVVMGDESTMVLISQGNQGEIQTEDGQTYTIMMSDQSIEQGEEINLAQVVDAGSGEISMATAQQVLAALEAAGGTGEQSLISVIGQSGEEIQVKVVQELPSAEEEHEEVEGVTEDVMEVATEVIGEPTEEALASEIIVTQTE